MGDDCVTGDQEVAWLPGAEAAAEETATAEGAQREIAEEDLVTEDQWMFMIDPAWQANEDVTEPPVEAVVGGWFVQTNGATGRFRPNPAYEPSMPNLPSDPVDAALQLTALGEADGDEVLTVANDVIFGVALDEEGEAIVAPSPDDVQTVLVTTAPRHRTRVAAADWAEVTVEELADGLPDEGVDVWLNPGAPSSMRILTMALKQFVAGGEVDDGRGGEQSSADSLAGTGWR